MSTFPASKARATGSRKLRWLAGGYAFFGLGLAGMLLPVLPTTIFWILAAGCFARSSPDMYRRIVRHPRLGRNIELFLEGGNIGRGAKVSAIFGMTLGLALLLMSPAPVWAQVTGAALIVLAAVFVVTRPGSPGS